MYMVYLDPKNDLCFKKVFGEHPHLLKSFLNAMLPLEEGRQIESLEYLSPEMVPENPLQKHSIVDVRCRDNHGRQFIVEMQMHWTTSFMQRVLLNASKAYVRQLDYAHTFSKLEPVYALNLVNDIFQPDKEEYYHHYQIVNIADTDQQIEGLEFIFIELPKFKAKNITEKKLQVLWLRFLTEINESTRYAPDDLLEIPEISEAIENMRTSAFDRAELERYDKYLDSIRVETTLMYEKFEKGKTEGLEEGRAEGEQHKALKMAFKMIAKGISLKEIMDITELPESTIQKLSGLYDEHGKDAIKHIDILRDQG